MRTLTMRLAGAIIRPITRYAGKQLAAYRPWLIIAISKPFEKYGMASRPTDNNTSYLVSHGFQVLTMTQATKARSMKLDKPVDVFRCREDQ
jgi:hypothetical protein